MKILMTCAKKLSFQVKQKKKRKRRKPAYLNDTSEEEEVTEDKDNSPTNSFVLPPSHYQQQNSDEDESFPVNAISTIVAVPKHSIDIIETVNMLESRSSCVSTTEVSENNGVSEKSFFQESNNFDSAYGHETTGKVASTTLQNKILTQSEKKTSIVKVRNVDKATENLAGSSKQRRTENMTSANADPEIDANPVRAKSAENYPAQNHQVPECNRTRVSEPVTEERFLTYFKCLNTKLNHIINLLKDRCTEMLVDEAENLLPNFPLRTVQEFEQFQENLVTSLEIQKLYIREIKMVGGSDPGKFTRATLHFLISNELALQYSWSGQKNTRKFRDTLTTKKNLTKVKKIRQVYI